MSMRETKVSIIISTHLVAFEGLRLLAWRVIIVIHDPFGLTLTPYLVSSYLSKG